MQFILSLPRVCMFRCHMLPLPVLSWTRCYQLKISWVTAHPPLSLSIPVLHSWTVLLLARSWGHTQLQRSTTLTISPSLSPTYPLVARWRDSPRRRHGMPTWTMEPTTVICVTLPTVPGWLWASMASRRRRATPSAPSTPLTTVLSTESSYAIMGCGYAMLRSLNCI